MTIVREQYALLQIFISWVSILSRVFCCINSFKMSKMSRIYHGRNEVLLKSQGQKFP